ncbi:MAG: hypothetical protein H6807_14240 [Planctomycetes bacterium]|nr:hypothetical protein [Planctomycetota bacterium]
MTGDKMRQCTGCGETVGITANFCEFCGQRMDAVAVAAKAARPLPPLDDDMPEYDSGRYLAEFDARDAARLSHEYFEAHVQLLKGHRKRLKTLARALDDHEQRLNSFGRGPIGKQRTGEIQGILEAVEALGDEWEDLQLAYNRESEALDEDFQDRFAEVELDVELPEDLQETMGRELEVMTRSFDRIGERIATLGTLGNAMIARAEGRYFGSESGTGGIGRVVLGAFLGWIGTALWMHLGGELPLGISLLYGSPAFLLPIAFVTIRG